MIRGSTELNSRNAAVPPGNSGTPQSHRTGPETGRERMNGSRAPEDDQPMPEYELQDWEIDDEEMPDEETPKRTGTIGLSEFIDIYKEAIARTVTEAYAPMYRPGEPGQDQPLPRLMRRPMGAQEHAIRGAALSLEVNPGTIIVGEMGTGKTYIGAAAAHMNGHRNVLVLCPPHLVPKWKREIEMTVPGARAAIVRTITDLQRLSQPTREGGPRFTIMSRETAKLSYRWEPAYVTRLPVSINADRTNCCPGCFEQILDKDGIPVLPKELLRKHMKCLECGGALWQPKLEEHKSGCSCRKCGGTAGANPTYKNRKYALADYIKKRMDGYFDLLIADEVHEYKARGSAQGIAAGNLAQACGNVLTLTGTLAGGYSSTLFHLLYRFTPEIRTEFKHNELARWIDRYGFRQRKYRSKGRDDDEPLDHGRGSGRRGYRTIEKETPGLAPAALFHIIGNTVFLRLSDVSSSLPSYEETIMVQQMSRKEDKYSGYSQRSAYQYLYSELRTALAEALARGSTRLMAAYLQSLLAFPDGCIKGEQVVDPKDRRLIVSVPPLDKDETYPKEQTLIDLAKVEKREGRRMLVYTTHTDTRDLTGRIEQFLNREGIRTAVLKSNTVKSERREAWVGQKVKEGIDVLICNPRLVQTGLDLVDFPTIIWYETDYSVYTMRQASRRSWRIGQTRPVKVIFMVYEATIQADALKLVARKMQSSLAVEGELPEDGLTAFGDDSEDLIMTLARQIINETDLNAGDSLENIFARARESEKENERYLVDDQWGIDAFQPEPELEPAGKPVQDEPVQPSIFSWTEFMAQPVENTRRRRKKEPEAQSLFQWAVEQETTGGTSQ